MADDKITLAMARLNATRQSLINNFNGGISFFEPAAETAEMQHEGFAPTRAPYTLLQNEEESQGHQGCSAML